MVGWIKRSDCEECGGLWELYEMMNKKKCKCDSRDKDVRPTALIELQEVKMNLTEAVERACQEKTLLDALTFICIWESERIVKQARKNEQWETCFRISLGAVMTTWDRRIGGKEIIENETAPYCLNSRRWLDFCFNGVPKSCPYLGDQGNVDCVYEKCGYFENRKTSQRYKRNMKILYSFMKE